MLILFLILVLLKIETSSPINAIEPGFPFKIGTSHSYLDFVYALYQNTPIYGGTSDSGQYTVSYVQEHLATPNSILTTIVFNTLKPSGSKQLIYTILPQQITMTNFVLNLHIPISLHSALLIGYMTIIDGFGITLGYYTLNQLQVTDDASYKRYQVITTSYITSGQQIYASVFISSIKINNMEITDMMGSSTSVSSNYLKIQFQYPLTTTIDYLTLQLYLHRKLEFDTRIAAAGFTNYIYSSVDYTGVESALTTFVSSTNTTSTIYFLGGMTHGPFRRSMRFSIQVSTISSPQADYNTEYIYEKDPSTYSMKGAIPYATVAETARFRGVWFYRNICNTSGYPYLLTVKQKCFDICPKLFYNSSSSRCSRCAQCTNILNCDYCYYSACQSDQYYIPTNKTCPKCTTLHSGCSTCFKGACTACDATLGLVASGGSCLCSVGHYVDTHGDCKNCSQTLRCGQCNDQLTCTLCTFPYRLTVNLTCLDCQYPYVFDGTSSSCVLRPYSFTTSFDDTDKLLGKYTVKLFFEDNLTLVLSNYNYVLRADLDVVILQSGDTDLDFANNKITFQISVSPSSVYDILKIQFVQVGSYGILSKLSQEFYISPAIIISPDQPQLQQDPEPEPEPDLQPQPQPEPDEDQDIQPGPYPEQDNDKDSEDEKGQMQHVKSFVNVMEQNSGLILSTLSLSSLSGYAIGILWNFQIASFYLFIQLQTPSKLNQFLNSTVQMQNIQILPFSIPSPYSQHTIISGSQKYQDYDIDLYFLRSNFTDIMGVIIFSVFYCVLYLLLKNLMASNFLTKYIKKKCVRQVYSNIATTFYQIITTLTFTAAATLSNRNYSNNQFHNHVAALIGLFFALTFCIMHPIILFRYKAQNYQDTQDCYLGLKKQKIHSEMTLTLFLLSQLVIPISIPLLHPIFSLSLIILSNSINLIFLIKSPTVKIKICVYYRIISSVSFITFNSLFLVYYVISNYYPEINLKDMSGLGYTSIVFIGIVIGLEFVQMVTQVIFDIIKIIAKIKKRFTTQKIQTQQTQEKQIKQSTQPNEDSYNNSYNENQKTIKTFGNQSERQKTEALIVKFNDEFDRSEITLKSIENCEVKSAESLAVSVHETESNQKENKENKTIRKSRAKTAKSKIITTILQSKIQ